MLVNFDYQIDWIKKHLLEMTGLLIHELTKTVLICIQPT